MRHRNLDHERPARLEMRRGVLEARNLLVLRRQVHDRVEDEVREREGPVDSRRREVADRYLDVFTARLRPQLSDHRLRQVDAVHSDATLTERQRDAAGADAELERSAVARQPDEEVDRGIDVLELIVARYGLVVAGCDVLAEVVLGHRMTIRP